jgi:alkaline phosphatase
MIKSANLIIGRLAIIGVIFLSITISCTKDKSKSLASNPRNIILMIGDGMGVTQVYAGLTANGGHLNLESCTYVGLQKTYSASSYITDSGASGTALATGRKTYNGAIAVDTNGLRLKTILEMAEEAGLSTGLVATSTITHATPASFVAHNPDRGKYEEIAMDFTGAGLDVIIGGGRNHFNKREDKLDLIDKLSEEGFQVTERIEQVDAAHQGPVAVFTDSLAMPPALRGRGDLLPRATELAIGRLSRNNKGFFLMVEGSQIDWAGHDNNTEYLVSEMVDFDDAIGKALDFARKNPETLVIITADHETGAMAIEKGDMESGEVSGLYGSEGHTGVMVPVFAYGPGAESFAGIYENTDIFEKMAGLLDLD